MKNPDDVLSLKRNQLAGVAELREHYRKSPELTWLFFEITNRCNLHCRHCGSNCGAHGEELTVADVRKTLQSIDPAKAPMVCLTGGEPLMHPSFQDIAATVSEMGFYWGMTTNATLITPEMAKALKRFRMSTVSVSLDGLEQAHDELRESNGSWRKAVDGIRNLLDADFSPQVTTVVHNGNIQDMEPLYNTVRDLGVQNWRLINVEPIGRACESNGLLLNKSGFRWLINYIQGKRYDPECKMEVTYGCSHYLGVKEERMVRDQYFMCGAGLFVASIRSNGDICACLDIENRPELVQGNIHRDDFMQVWNDRFQAFRVDRTGSSTTCRECGDRWLCGGDSTHTWDYDKNEPRLCGMRMLEDSF